MISYKNMIMQWNNSVTQYCTVHDIPNMDLKNLRMGDVYNYELYAAYKNVQNAIAEYTKTPESPFYTNKLVNCIKKWYLLISDNNLDKMAVRIMPTSCLKGVFARMIQNIK